MQKIKPTHQAGHQSIYRSTVTINVKYGTFSLSKKAREVMKVSHLSNFDIFKDKNKYFFKPCPFGEFTFTIKQSHPNRLYCTDKEVSKQIKDAYGIGSESFMLSIGEKPVTIGNEDNCFILNK